MLLGLAMVAGSGWLIFENRTEDEAAGSYSEQALVEIKDVIAAEPKPTVAPHTAEVEPVATPIPEMPTMEIDGQEYVGYLELPTIGLSLPVMSEWSYAKLRVAPCRYWGSAYDDTMVIMAHNYDRHFGRVSSLNIGDPVQFVDAEGNIFKYVVAAQETLQRTDVDLMLDSEYDLTLFTCTYGGASRITVRLNRVLAYAN